MARGAVVARHWRHHTSPWSPEFLTLNSGGVAPGPAAGSFRDPQGRVVEYGQNVYRTLIRPLASFPATWAEDGPLAPLVAAGKLWPAVPLSREVVPAPVRDLFPQAVGFLQHPRLTPITYPFEWPFELLKRAALLHIEVHRHALRRGLSLTDGSAYNVQFLGARPVFIDALAFVPQEDGKPWAGYSQFCESFLNPLLLSSGGCTSVNDIYRGRMSGISTRETSRQLGWWGALRARALVHVTIGSMAEAASTRDHVDGRTGFTRAGLELLLRSLQRTIERLEYPRDARDWSGYETNNTYSEAERHAKIMAVQEFVARVRPALLLDAGCNAGEYSELALRSGAGYVIGLERDGGAANQAVHRAVRLEKPFLPLQVDLKNPTPSQGWNLSERVSFQERVKPDAVLCLALVHHLVLGEGVPLDVVLPSILGLAPRGLIEFVPLEDPMARRIAGPADRMRHPYCHSSFIAELEKHAEVLKQTPLTASGRVLVEYARSR